MIVPSHAGLSKRVRGLRLKVGTLIDGQLVGTYESLFKGEGIEFEETRPYQHGDPVRWIDWRVTARSAIPYVKQFRQQRDLTVQLVVDGSASMFVTGMGRTPFDAAIDVAAILVGLADDQHDQVGLTIFENSIAHFVPPRRSAEHSSRLVRDLLAWRPRDSGTRLDKPIEHFFRFHRNRALMVLVSDFTALPDRGLMRAVSSRHQVLPVVVCHPRERRLPRCGLVRVVDPETGRHVGLDTHSTRLRQHYNRSADQHHADIERFFRELSMPALSLSSDDDVVAKLHRFTQRPLQ